MFKLEKLESKTRGTVSLKAIFAGVLALKKGPARNFSSELIQILLLKKVSKIS
jgi:hypothetical protein